MGGGLGCLPPPLLVLVLEKGNKLFSCTPAPTLGTPQNSRGQRAFQLPNVPWSQCPFPFPCQKELAELKHQYSLEELKHQENQIQAQLENEQDLQKELEKHRVPSAGAGGGGALPLPTPALPRSAQTHTPVCCSGLGRWS